MNRYIARTVLITGGGRGIGRATALRLAREGAAVAVVDRDLEPAQAVVREIAAMGRTGVAIRADVSDEAAVTQMVHDAERALGPLHVLVNNAALATRGSIALTTPADWDNEFAVTLRAVFLVTRTVLIGMVERGKGAIVSVASVNGIGAFGNPAYSAAKAGVLSFTQQLALEYGPMGIRANAVSPGTIRTEAPSWQKRLEEDPRVFEKLARWYPVGRVGNPDDIAAAIAYLGADEAGFVNGTNLVVDGGLTAGPAPMLAELTLETRAQTREAKGEAA